MSNSAVPPPSTTRASHSAERLAGLARGLSRWCMRLVICSGIGLGLTVWAMLAPPQWPTWGVTLVAAGAGVPTVIMALFWWFLTDLIELPATLGRLAGGAQQLHQQARSVAPAPRRRWFAGGRALYDLYDAVSTANDLFGRSGAVAFWASPVGWMLLLAGWIGANLVTLIGAFAGLRMLSTGG